MFTNKLLVLLVLSVLACRMAAAQDGLYVWGGVGASDMDIQFGVVTGVNDDDASYSVGLGYRWSQHFAIEGAYHDFGTNSGQTNCPPDLACIAIPLSTSADVDGVSLAAVGFVPLTDRFELYGKLGIMSWDVGFAGLSSAFDDSGEDLFYAAGVGWNSGEALQVFAEFEHLELDIDTARVGIRYRF